MKLFRYHPLMRFAFAVFFTMIRRHPALTRIWAFRISAVCLLVLALTVIGRPAAAADLWVGAYAPPVEVEAFCSSCIRDDIYADTKLIAHQARTAYLTRSSPDISVAEDAFEVQVKAEA